MKKLLSLLLALSLCVLPVFSAFAEEEGVTEEPETVEMYPEELVAALAAMYAEFDGAPDADTAWAVLSGYANRFNQEAYSYAEMEEMYGSFFADGSFADIAEEPSSLFASDGNGGYTLEFADGEAAKMIAINAVNDNGDGTMNVDFSSWADVHGNWEEFRFNGTVVIEENAESPWGCAALSCAVDDSVVDAFTGVGADAVLDDQYSFNYAPENIMDGDLATCWAYTGSALKPYLTLYAEEVQEVRGIALTPGYAKNDDIFAKNNRVKALEVVFADGTEKTFKLDEVEMFDGMRVLPFEGIVLTDSISIRVTEVYPGSKYDDVCISELIVF